MSDSSRLGKRIIILMSVLALSLLVLQGLMEYKSQLHYVEIEVTRQVEVSVTRVVEKEVIVTQPPVFYIVRITPEVVVTPGEPIPTPQATPMGVPLGAEIVYVESVDAGGNPINQAHATDVVGLRCDPSYFEGDSLREFQVVSWLDPRERIEIFALPPDNVAQNMVGVKSLDNPDKVGWVPIDFIAIDTAVDNSLPRTPHILEGCWVVPEHLLGLQVQGKLFGTTDPYGVQVPLRCQPSSSSGNRLNIVFADGQVQPVLIQGRYEGWYFVKVWAGEPFEGIEGWMPMESVGLVIPNPDVHVLSTEEAQDMYRC